MNSTIKIKIKGIWIQAGKTGLMALILSKKKTTHYCWEQIEIRDR